MAENIMTFEQLQFFIAAVKENTFFDAAETLHTTQSTLSKQIQKLEQELEVTLFDRSRRSAVLTDAGRQFFTDAQKLMAQYHQSLSHLQKYKTNPTLCIGSLPILGQYALTEKFQEFSNCYPEISLTIEEAEETELLKGFKEGHFDMIIARELPPATVSAQAWKIAEDELMAILPDSHKLCKQDYVSIDELQQESFFLMNPYTSIYHRCCQLFEEAHIQPRILRTGRLETILSSIAVQNTVSLLPYHSFRLFCHEHVTALPLSPPVSLPVLLIGKNDRRLTPAMNKLIKYIQYETDITSQQDS